MCGCLSWDLACNPGMCLDWELNQQPFGLQPMLNPLSYVSQGLSFFLFFFFFFLILERGSGGGREEKHQFVVASNQGSNLQLSSVRTVL